MTIARRLLMIAAVMLATIVCALPWGGPPHLQLVLPMLPYALVHRGVERWGGLMPDWLAFLAGFMLDVAGQGPLGYWALIYLCGYTMVRSVAARRALDRLASLVFFALTAAILGAMQWAVASIYYGRAIDVLPIALAASGAMLAYLVLMTTMPLPMPQPRLASPGLGRGR